MKRLLQFSWKQAGSIGLGLGCWLLAGVAAAYPPAPHHVLFGQVRNQWGDPLDVSAASVFVIAGGREGVRAAVSPSRQPGVNYTLKVPMDSLTRSDLYQPSALGRTQQFVLKVQIGNVTYLPLEMTTIAPVIGQPAQSTRIDLTLGVDSDGDGLPDAWEEAIIAMFGGTLASITPNGDADGDGLTNLQEYLAGTLPFDPADGFRLAVTQVDAAGTSLEFMAIRGRTYAIQYSTNLTHWLPTQFRQLNGQLVGSLQDNYLALDIRLLQVVVPPAGNTTNRFFRAVIQ